MKHNYFLDQQNMFLYCCNIKCCAKCCCLIANDKTDVNIFTAIISGKLHVAKQKTKLTDRSNWAKNLFNYITRKISII